MIEMGMKFFLYLSGRTFRSLLVIHLSGEKLRSKLQFCSVKIQIPLFEYHL